MFALAALVAPVAPAYADSPGQLSNAPTNYEVKNVTKGGSYSQSASATCGDTVKYSVLLSNSDYGMLRNLTVQANLGSGAISASAVNAANATTSVSGSVAVSLDKGTLVYVPGSSVRVSSNGTTRTPLADGVTAGGVNVGELAGSTETFVQFDAKVNCPVVPPVKIKVCELSTKNIIMIDEKDFDASKHSKDLNKCAPAQPGNIKVCVIASKEIVTIKENEFDASKHTKDLNVCAKTELPAELPHTGMNGAVMAFAASIVAGAAAYAVRARKNLAK